ncbi:MAG: outer membrane beta-barrel protein [Bacteroidetes bacterium]|nr:outer membrane beta-barrel protein [Bacteroidota bacterium]
MLKKIVCLFALAMCSQKAFSQNYFGGSEYGISIGGSQYFGDLNDNYGFRFIRPALGGFARLHLNPYIALKGGINYTRVGYDDKYSSNVYNQKRNLNFQSDVFEAVVQAEFNFFRFTTGEVGNRWTPYLTGGIGAFYYNPFTEFNGRRYYLRPLGTEGQNAGYSDRKYNKIAMCFPIGVGFKYWLRPGLNFGFEIADRLTTTDYLDDVSTTYVGSNNFPNDPQNPNPAYYLQDRSLQSNPNDPLGRPGKQRGNSGTKDQYLMFIFNLSFQLKVYKCPAYMNRGIMDF